MESSRMPLVMKRRSIELLEEGPSISAVASLFGWSRQTMSKWWGRSQRAGAEGLADQSTRPRTRPTQLPDRAVQQILRLRPRERLGPARSALRLGLSHTTVYRTLCRQSRQHLRPTPPRVLQRDEKAAPGERFHLDIQTLVPLRRRTPAESPFAVLDDFSREAVRRISPTATPAPPRTSSWPPCGTPATRSRRS